MRVTNSESCFLEETEIDDRSECIGNVFGNLETHDDSKAEVRVRGEVQ